MVLFMVRVTQAGGPTESTSFDTGLHAPVPPFAFGTHHCTNVEPPRSQSAMVAEVNEFGVDTRTSKKVPPVVKVGVPTGFEAYLPAVIAPRPFPVAVIEPEVVVEVAVAEPLAFGLVPWEQF